MVSSFQAFQLRISVRFFLCHGATCFLFPTSQSIALIIIMLIFGAEQTLASHYAVFSVFSLCLLLLQNAVLSGLYWKFSHLQGERQDCLHLLLALQPLVGFGLLQWYKPDFSVSDETCPVLLFQFVWIIRHLISLYILRHPLDLIVMGFHSVIFHPVKIFPPFYTLCSYIFSYIFSSH